MLTTLESIVKSFVRPINVRLVFFALMLLLIILGAGAPGATGV